MASRPNILFFFTDDQRFDTIRALGNEAILTPNMDALVRGGTAFTHAHIMGGSCGAVCMPSRAMLMSGRTLFHIQGQGEEIPEDHVTLPELLRRNGYATFGTGKWHNGAAAYTRAFSHGAEIFFGGMDDHWNVPACDFDPAGHYPEPRELTARFGGLTADVKRRYDHILHGKHSSELFCDAAVDFLQGYESPDPFFMYVSFMAPHDPREMPAEYLDMYDADAIPLPPNFMPAHPFDNGELRIRDESLAAWPRDPAEIRRHLRDYYAMITHADAQMGRVLQALRDSGRANNTLIVFAGDNGLALGQHGLMGKQNCYDHSMRVPLVLCGPGVPQGERRDAFCYLLDIYPTLCELLQLDPPESVEGRSMVPAMASPEAVVRDTVFCAYRRIQRSVRDRRFKLIEYKVDGARTTQLFDMAADPWELNDLSAAPEHARDVARLRERLKGWRTELDDDADMLP